MSLGAPLRGGGLDAAHGPYQRLILTGGIHGAPEIRGLLGGPIIGVAEQRLGYADMLRIADRQLRRDDLAEQVRIQAVTKLSSRNGADDAPDSLCGDRSAAVADPECVPGHRVF